MEKKIIKIAICDDSSIDRSIIRRILKDYFTVNENITCKIYEYETGEAFMSGEQDIDLVFLDIMMPGINGMDVARRLVDEDSDTRIVFTTSSVDYVSEGYDVSALHYLVKPFKPEKLVEVLDRFVARLKSIRTVELKIGRNKRTFFTDDIYWIESANHNAIIHLAESEEIATGSLGDISELFISQDFVKVNRFALVNMRKMTTIPSETVVLTNGEELKVSPKEIVGVKAAYLRFINEA